MEQRKCILLIRNTNQPRELKMDSKMIYRTLVALERETGLPYSGKKVLSTVFNLIRKYSTLEPEVVWSEILRRITDGTVEKLFRGRTDGNLSICIYYSGWYAITNVLKTMGGQKRSVDMVSLDRTISSEDSEDTLESMIGNEDHSFNDDISLMKSFAETLTDKEKILYVYFLEDRRNSVIAKELGISKVAVGKMKEKFYTMARKRLTAMAAY